MQYNNIGIILARNTPWDISKFIYGLGYYMMERMYLIEIACKNYAKPNGLYTIVWISNIYINLKGKKRYLFVRTFM